MGSFLADSTQELQQFAIERLVHAASRGDDRREAERFPYFQPVEIAGGKQPDGSWMFIREVSQSGIGLVHNQSLDCGQVVLAIQDESGQAMELPTEILWCRPCENGLFISGGRFVTSAR
ncbi:MAG: PilZ domain-containing protein [Pirellulales bacterium]